MEQTAQPEKSHIAPLRSLVWAAPRSRSAQQTKRWLQNTHTRDKVISRPGMDTTVVSHQLLSLPLLPSASHNSCYNSNERQPGNFRT